MNDAVSTATIKSHANAKDAPAPAATPFILPMMGFGISRIALMMGLYRLYNESLKDRFFDPAIAFKS